MTELRLVIRPSEGAQRRHTRTEYARSADCAWVAHTADLQQGKIELVCARTAQQQPHQQDVGKVGDENGGGRNRHFGDYSGKTARLQASRGQGDGVAGGGVRRPRSRVITHMR